MKHLQRRRQGCFLTPVRVIGADTRPGHCTNDDRRGAQAEGLKIEHVELVVAVRLARICRDACLTCGAMVPWCGTVMLCLSLCVVRVWCISAMSHVALYPFEVCE